MRHPFHGIIGPATSETRTQIRPTSQNPIGRRSFFGHALAAVAGVGAFFFTRSAAAQTGWDAGGGIGFPEGGALQGGYGGGIGSLPSGGGTVTTYAIGEEGGYYPPPSWSSGRVTTYALGEEGGYYYRRPRYSRYPRYTTYALGEEGGGGGGYYRRW